MFGCAGALQIAAAAVCLAMVVPALGATVIAGPDPQSAEPMSVSGVGPLNWTNVRVTRNGAADAFPSMDVGPNGEAYLLWESARSPSGNYYVSLSSRWHFLSQETFITQGTRTRPGPDVPLGTGIARDINRNLGAVWDDGGNDIWFMKFDDQGNVLMSTRRVGANDTAQSLSPSISRAGPSLFAVVHEDCSGSCWRILLNTIWTGNGTGDSVDVDLSSGVTTSAHNAMIVANSTWDRLAVTFGSNNGSFVTEVDPSGNVTRAPVQIRTATDMKPLRALYSSDNSLHLLWNENDGIHYARLDANFSVVVSDTRIVASTTAGFPAAALRLDDSVDVIYSEGAAGAARLYDVRLKGTDWTPDPANKTLVAGSVGESVRPEAKSDRVGRVLVVFEDTRNGNREVYLADGRPIPMQLEVTTPGLILVARGESASIGARVTSWLYPGSEQYYVNVSLDAGDPTTLIFESQKLTGLLDPGDSVSATFNVSVRPSAGWNETWSLIIEATSASEPTVFENATVTVSAFWRAQETLSTRTGPVLLPGAPGETVTFPLYLRNTGTQEDTVDLVMSNISDPRWSAVLSDSLVQVPGNGTTWMTTNLSVAVPLDGWAREEGCVRIDATSRVDPLGHADLTVCVLVRTVVHIDLQADRLDAEGDPGATAELTIQVTNAGNTPPDTVWNFTIDVFPGTGPQWPAQVNVTTLSLAAGETASVRLTVAVPAGAMAYDSTTVQFSAYSANYAYSKIQNLTVTAAAVRDLWVSDLNTEPPGASGWQYFALYVGNDGNQDEYVDANITGVPDGWIVRVQMASSPIAFLTLAPGQAAALEVLAIPADGAIAGEYPMELEFETPDGFLLHVGIRATVEAVHEVVIGAMDGGHSQTSGAFVVAGVRVDNKGNGWENITFQVAFAWSGAVAPTLPGGTNVPVTQLPGGDGRITTFAFSLGPGSSTELRFNITIPWGTERGDWPVNYTLTTDEGSWVRTLHVTVQLMQVALDGIQTVPASPDGGERVAVQATLTNVGDVTVPAMRVSLIVDGGEPQFVEVSALATGMSWLLSFNVTLADGVHKLWVVIDPDGEVPFNQPRPIRSEVNVTVETLLPPDDPATPALGAVGTALAVAIVAAIGGARRRARA